MSKLSSFAFVRKPTNVRVEERYATYFAKIRTFERLLLMHVKVMRIASNETRRTSDTLGYSGTGTGT